MISDRALIRISLAVAVTGIIALFIVVSVTGYKSTNIADLKNGENVAVHGVVDGYRESKGNVFFTLVNGSNVKIVMFATDAERQPSVYELKDSDAVLVNGKTQYYRNGLEIVAKTITSS